VRRAAQAARVSPFAHYRRLERDPSYKLAFDQAWNDGCQRLEDEATRRAVEGWDEPVYQGGQRVGTKRKFSDRLLIARLEAEMPGKYGRQVLEHSGPGGEPIAVTVRFVKPDGSQLPG